MPKRWLPLLFSAVLLAAASGCGKYAPEPSTGPSTGVVDAETGGVTLGLQETARVSGIVITLNQVETLADGPGLQEGYVYIMVNLTLKNEGSSPYTLSTPHFSLTSTAGDRAPYSPQGTMQRSPQLQGTLLQGKEVQGWLGFMAKAEADGFTLTFSHPTGSTAIWAFSRP